MDWVYLYNVHVCLLWILPLCRPLVWHRCIEDLQNDRTADETLLAYFTYFTYIRTFPSVNHIRSGRLVKVRGEMGTWGHLNGCWAEQKSGTKDRPGDVIFHILHQSFL